MKNWHLKTLLVSKVRHLSLDWVLKKNPKHLFWGGHISAGLTKVSSTWGELCFAPLQFKCSTWDKTAQSCSETSGHSVPLAPLFPAFLPMEMQWKFSKRHKQAASYLNCSFAVGNGYFKHSTHVLTVFVPNLWYFCLYIVNSSVSSSSWHLACLNILASLWEHGNRPHPSKDW